MVDSLAGRDVDVQQTMRPITTRQAVTHGVCSTSWCRIGAIQAFIRQYSPTVQSTPTKTVDLESSSSQEEHSNNTVILSFAAVSVCQTSISIVASRLGASFCRDYLRTPMITCHASVLSNKTKMDADLARTKPAWMRDLQIVRCRLPLVYSHNDVTPRNHRWNLEACILQGASPLL
jgi:hypothetical protein